MAASTNFIVQSNSPPETVGSLAAHDNWTTDIHNVFSPSTALGALIDALIVIILAWAAGRLVALTVKRALSRPRHIPADPTAIRFLGQLARAGVYAFAFVTYAHLVPSLQTMGHAWLLSAGAASVVLGLAAQSTLGNLIAGVSLLLYRPFNIGDSVQVSTPAGVETGVVESLNLGYTVLRTPDSRRIVIPNNTMASQTSINLSSDTLPGKRLVCQIPLSVAPGTDLERVRKVLQELVKAQSNSREYVGCPVTAISNNSVTLTLKVWAEDFQDATDLKANILEAVQNRFKNESIELR